MSCNLQYSNNKLVQVVNDQGQPSQLYREAVSKFGKEKALDIFLTSKSDNFTEIFGKDEPSLQTVMKYITEENKITEPLNKEQIVDLQDFNQNVSVDSLVNTFYDEFGIFSVSAEKLKDSKLYSDYEIRNLQNDVELQEKVKLSLEALIHTENAEESLPQQNQTEKTGIINSFGKLVSINPEIIEKEIVEKLGGTTQDEFNQIVEDIDYPKFQDSLQKPVDKSLIQKVIDQLKKTKLANNVFVLSNKEIVNKLVELGVSEKLAKQVVAWHGSPYSFDKFTTNAIGTGEGVQAFGWGLYFTDLESIAKDYANKLAIYAKPSETFRRLKAQLYDRKGEELLNLITIEQDKISGLLEFKKALFGTEDVEIIGNSLLTTEERGYLEREAKNEKSSIDYVSKMQGYLYLDNIISDFYKALDSSRNLYKVSLHKGKEAGEYTWLEWDKPLTSEQKNLIKEKALKSEKLKNSKGFIEYELTDKSVFTGNDVYASLMRKLASDKNASLFLLESGIDGIKYPAESISSGAKSDNARGFNYVVFDENAVTVDEKIQFQKDITLTSSGFVHKGIIFLNNDVMKLDTPVHEFGHLYLNWLKSERGDLYQKGLELAQSKDAKEYADYVEKTQPNLAGEAKLNEILAQAIGDNGAKLVDKSWIENLWDEIKKLFGLSQYTNKQIQNMNLEQFTKAIAVDLYKEDLFKQMQEYKKADVFIEVEGEIRQKNNVETEITIPLTTKIITNEVIKDSLDNLLNINLDILSDNYEQTEKVLTAIENELISNGLDVVGLSKKPIDSELIEFLKELTIFINSPTRENTKSYANLSDEYFERDVTPQKTVIKTDKKLEYVTLNTNLSEEEVYTKSGLIKVKDNLYVKSAKESLEKLYSNLETYTEKYPKDKTIQEYVQEQIAKTKGFNNAENAEAVYLYKMYFNIEKYTPKINKPQIKYKKIRLIENNTLSLQDTTKLAIEPPIYLSVKQISLAETSEEMIQIKQKQDRIKKEWEVLEEIKNCVWS
jgi:hypothetical protein